MTSKTKQPSRMNLNIELMRFIFSVVIILYHIDNRVAIPEIPHITFFSNGKIGVEFFFLVSGYLMAKSAERYNEPSPLVTSTKRFIFRKFSAIIPYHLVTFFCMSCDYVNARLV